MRKTSYILLCTLLAAGLWGCEKIEFDKAAQGEALAGFQLAAPANNLNLVLNSATPDSPVVVEWTAAKTGVDAPVTYAWIAAPKTGGSLDNPLLTLPSDNNGTATRLTLTQKTLDDALKAKGVADNARTELVWAVEANNGSRKVRSAQTFQVAVTRFGNGVSNFAVYGPLSSFTPLEMDEETPDAPIKITWQPARSGKDGVPVTYKWVAVRRGESFSTPLIEIQASKNGTDTTLTLTQKQVNDALTAKGIAAAQTVQLDWTVVAMAGTFAKTADYTNTIALTTFGTPKKLYLVGQFNGWNINAPLEMIGDKSNGRRGVYYSYIMAGPNDKFLIIKKPGDWGSKYGDGGNNTIVAGGGGDFQPAAPGIYRVVVDMPNLKGYVQAKPLGLVGDMQGWNAAAPIPMFLSKPNQFIFFTNLKNGQGFKFHDGFEWNDPGLDKARYFGDAGASTPAATRLLQAPGNNVNVSVADGFYRINADLTAMKYTITKGTVYLIGSATPGGWDNSPGNANLPAMTYLSDGKWKATVTLAAGEFKFIFEKGNWDYNYGSDGATNTLKEGGDNLKVAQAGSYTVELDEYARTFTVTAN